MSLCVYALAAPGRGRLAATGIGREPVRRVRLGGVDAVIGEMESAPKPTLDALERYDRLIASLWRRRLTLLPVRFGTVARDRTELERWVRAQPDVVRRLAAVRHRAQMTLRLPAAHRQPPRPSGRARTLKKKRSPGTRYLQQRAAESRSVEADALRAAVRRWVRTERVERRGRIVTVYHLIPRGAARRYRAAVMRAAEAAGVPVMISGPFPPYAFSGT